MIPVVTLDPAGTDHHGEAARLRELGPVVRVVLPGGVEAWSVTHHALLADLLTDRRVSKDWHNWTAIRDGDIADDWPLIGMVKVTNMVTADGREHHRSPAGDECCRHPPIELDHGPRELHAGQPSDHDGRPGHLVGDPSDRRRGNAVRVRRHGNRTEQLPGHLGRSSHWSCHR